MAAAVVEKATKSVVFRSGEGGILHYWAIIVAYNKNLNTFFSQAYKNVAACAHSAKKTIQPTHKNARTFQMSIF
jgi:hypothetical protein